MKAARCLEREMGYAIHKGRLSKSFPEGDPFFAKASKPDEADVLFCLGSPLPGDHRYVAVAIELDNECLADHVGLAHSPGNVFGFARYRNGSDAPSPLVEVVRHSSSDLKALDVLRSVLEKEGFVVAICSDQAGRIVDRLVRPKYNAALRLLDEGLATQSDMDLTCRLGLGYPDGPIERVLRGGLVNHYVITKALFETYGAAAYAPARQAVVAARRNSGA
jgi:3-hydroxybutyryl-CoA dehydrogenase